MRNRKFRKRKKKIKPANRKHTGSVSVIVSKIKNLFSILMGKKESNRIKATSTKKQNDTKIKESITMDTSSRTDKITKRDVVLCIFSLVLTTLFPFYFNVIHNKLFNAPTQPKSVSVRLLGDDNVLEKPGDVSAKTIYVGEDGEDITMNSNADSTWNCYAPHIKLDIEYTGTINSIYVFYKDDLEKELIMQKVHGTKARSLNCTKDTCSCDFILNYTRAGGLDNERIYIMIVGTDNNPSIYCALISRYEPGNLSDTELELKSSEEIYQTVPNRDRDYWSFHRNEIVSEISNLLKQKSGIDYSNFG